MRCPECGTQIAKRELICPACSSKAKKTGVENNFRKIFSSVTGTVFVIATLVMFALNIVMWFASSSGENISKTLLTVLFGQASRQNTELTAFILLIFYNLPGALMLIGIAMLKFYSSGKIQSTGMAWAKSGAIINMIYSALTLCALGILALMNALEIKSELASAVNVFITAFAAIMLFQLFYQISLIRFYSSVNNVFKDEANWRKPSMLAVVLNVINAVVGCVMLFVLLVSSNGGDLIIQIPASLAGIVHYIYFAAVILRCSDEFAEPDINPEHESYSGIISGYHSDATTDGREMTQIMSDCEPVKKTDCEPARLEGFCDLCGKRLDAGEMCSCKSNAEFPESVPTRMEKPVVRSCESKKSEPSYSSATGRLKSTMRTAEKSERRSEEDCYAGKKYFRKTNDIE